MANEIEVQVDYHASGRFTLKEKPVGTAMWSDVKTDGLLGNTVPVAFYRVVAKRLAAHATNGVVVVTYKATAP